MTRFIHRLSLSFYFIVVLLTIGLLTYIGFSYYRLPIEDSFFHPLYEQLKPSGIIGHGLGIFGSLIMLFGLFSYMARKRLKVFSRLGVLKYWLEFHIFLCTLGPVMILFHTSFKFGGIVSVGFWSMAVVWSSGVIGRFIYLQIPRTIEGRELSLREVENLKDQLDQELLSKYDIDFSEIKTSKFSAIKLKLISKDISRHDYRKVRRLINNEKRITRRIGRLDRMKNMFKYWHFAHLPFALILIIIMMIHVVVVLTFGYKWIF
jgi:hypothetical protein